MAEVINGQIYENIENLPVIDEIDNGMYLIVENNGQTNIIDYENFLIGTDNITFAQTITDLRTDVQTLSADQDATDTAIANVNAVLNGFMTVGYNLSAGSAGVTFSTTEYVLPVNIIQSNTIDGNLANAPTTLNGITSASNIINLNAGSYQVQAAASFDNAVMIDMYDDTNDQVLLTSNYTTNPVLQGVVSLQERSNILIRGYAASTTKLGIEEQPFYVATAQQTPLVATFQYLSAAAVTVVQPDPRT